MQKMSKSKLIKISENFTLTKSNNTDLYFHHQLLLLLLLFQSWQPDLIMKDFLTERNISGIILKYSI